MTPQQLIYPISEARSNFGKLVAETAKNKEILLTKKGKVQAALVNYEYLQTMKRDLDALYKKTYIDPKLLPYIRDFTDEEIQEWLEEDKL